MYYHRRKDNKYNSTKITRDGETFDSVQEYRRFCELRLLERAGEITNLKRQVEFELIPAQYEERETGEFYKRGERKGEPKMKTVCLEQSVKYTADFAYYEKGKYIVEDVKGYQDPASAGYAKFILKRKMMLYFHGIKIKEITRNTRQRKKKQNEDNAR